MLSLVNDEVIPWISIEQHIEIVKFHFFIFEISRYFYLNIGNVLALFDSKYTDVIHETKYMTNNSLDHRTLLTKYSMTCQHNCCRRM